MLPLLSRQRWQTTASARTVCISCHPGGSISPVSREIYAETPSGKGQSHIEWQHWTVQHLLEMYKNKIAYCKQLSAETLNSSFLAVSKILQSGRNKAKSRDTQSLCPSRVSAPRHQYKHPSVTSQLYQVCLALLSGTRQMPGHWPAHRSLTKLALHHPVNSPVTHLCSQKPKVTGRENAFLGTQKFCREIGIGAAVI